MVYTLILLYSGSAIAVVPNFYETAALCESAGSAFEQTANFGSSRRFVCIPAPTKK